MLYRHSYPKYFLLEYIFYWKIIYLCDNETKKRYYGMETICAIKDIYKTLYQFEKSFADKNDITINEAMILCCLKDNQAKSAGALRDFIGLSNSRVSKVITSVENKGFIHREINMSDKRQMFFSLTPEGSAKIQQMMTAEVDLSTLFKALRDCLPKE